MSDTINVMDLIKVMVPFDGKPGTVNRFIRSIDRIISALSDKNAATVELFTDLIRGKIVGKADEILVSVGDPSDWTSIKSHLITQFSDRRTQESILNKLNTVCQVGKSLEQYYAEVCDLQTALINSIDSTQSADYKKGQLEIYLGIVLKSFIAGLNHELGYIVRSNKPKDVKEAYDVALNELSMQNAARDRGRLASNQKQFIKPRIQMPTSTFTQNRPSTSHNTVYNNSPMYQPTHSQRPPQQFHKPNPFQNPNHYRPIQYNKPVFNQPQNQTFTPKPNLPNPTPMDISVQTRQPYRTLNSNQPYFKPTGPTHITSRELHNTEQYEVPDDYNEHNYNHNYYNYEYDNPEEPTDENNVTPEIDDVNFQLSCPNQTKS